MVVSTMAEEAPTALQPVEEMPAAVAPAEPDVLAMTPRDDVADVVEAEQAIDAVAPAAPPSFASAVEPVATTPANAVRRNLIQRVRDWLGRAA
jgi:8-oxo-dGTP diphosphatase